MDKAILGSIDIALRKAKTFTAIMKGQFDPQAMIDKMIAVVGADDGLYRNVWPPSIETLIKQVQDRAWTLRVRTT